jgi:adsorption protein B
LYFTGLTIALLFIAFSLDDLFLDIYYYLVGRHKVKGRLSLKDLDSVPARLLAVMIPAWNEDEVIGPMVENLLQSVNYPLSLVHIFLGVYPNDAATCQAAEVLAAKFPNVHLVTNRLPGPTSKAQNLNNVLKSILDFERDNRLRFAALLIHDAEDIVHPTSFKLANYLTYNNCDVVQLPVFPLQPYPTWRTFFKFITAATYADEFADNHYRGLPAREASGALVPSAGTGFIISRRVLDKIGDLNLFEEGSVTEDYRLSLRFKELGIHVNFFIEGVQRVLDNGKITIEYVATREIFPNTFREAVRQKSRWIYGISFQSFSYLKVLKNKNLSRITKYSLYRDWKAKFGNLLTLPGYAVFIYAIVSLFTSLPPIYPVGTFSWWLCVVLTFMMVERQMMRSAAIKNVYGWRSAVAACFIPPLLPLRIVWGNVINFFATFVAWRIALFGFPKKRPRWQKTKHSYLTPEVLARYKRRLGDLILERGLLEPKALAQAIKEARINNELLGAALARLKMVPQAELVKALGETLKIGYVRLVNKKGAENFPPKAIEVFEKNMVVPVAITAAQAVIAAKEPLPEKAIREISSCLDGRSITLVLTPEEDIIKQLSIIKNSSRDKEARRIGEALLEYGKITSEQLLEALRAQELNKKQLGQILIEMGVILGEDLDLFLASAKSPQDAYVAQAAPAKEEKEFKPGDLLG